MTIQDPKRLFDAIRKVKGAPLLQSDVDLINAALEATPSPTASVPLHPKIPMEVM